MQNFYQCESLASIKNWLKDNTNHTDWLASEFNRLKNYQNALEWNQLVLVCEAITIWGWHTPPFNHLVPVEANRGEGLSGSFGTALYESQWTKQAGSWREWRKSGDSFNIYEGADTTNYGVQKLNSQRTPLPTNPFKIGQVIANCQTSAIQFVAEIEKLNEMLNADMQPLQYGNDFYYANIYCYFSNHDEDGHPSVRHEYFHDMADIAKNLNEDYYNAHKPYLYDGFSYASVVPHIDYKKLSNKRGQLCWRVEISFTRAWGEMPLAQQKQAFSDDLQVIFTEFEARIAKKKLNYKAKQATTDATAIINKWLAA